MSFVPWPTSMPVGPGRWRADGQRAGRPMAARGDAHPSAPVPSQFCKSCLNALCPLWLKVFSPFADLRLPALPKTSLRLCVSAREKNYYGEDRRHATNDKRSAFPNPNLCFLCALCGLKRPFLSAPLREESQRWLTPGCGSRLRTWPPAVGLSNGWRRGGCR